LHARADVCHPDGRVPTLTATAAHHRDALIERVEGADEVRDVFRAATEGLRHLVQFDSSAWLGTDPATDLPTAPTQTENVGLDGIDECMRFWEREFLVEDVNLFGDLARRPTPAAALRASTRDRPSRSPRYREFLRPHGFGDELRAVMRVDGASWAAVALQRETGRPAFTEEDAALLAGLSAVIGRAVRERARALPDLPALTDDPGPGLMLFASDGELISANDDALAWLEQLAPDPPESARSGVDLPLVAAGTLMRARAVAAERDHRSARARLRSPRTGRWLVCHASCLRSASGELGDTALVIEPAKAAEIAPIIVQAYGLSSREREITQLIARGFATAQIAKHLHLSVHTVRDYVNAIFAKVGVSSRGELVAKLFAEHYAPLHFEAAAIERVSARN
jgi:DNA-binding CsgD family transcriptional regulator